MRAVVVLVCLAATPAVAQEPQPFAWPGHTRIAGHISDGVVVGTLAADATAALRADDRRVALTCTAWRTGLALGASELVKRLVSRTRPDGSDRKSFYSMHTSLAMAASGWSFRVGVPLALGAGYLRLAAHKHYLSDVLVGGGVGLLARGVCQEDR